MGDHNFCRNPDGTPLFQVWFYTTDPNLRVETCPVPFCPPLKALDLSLDNNGVPDENNTYTHASLQKANFPSSFTICTAFMVEAWAQDASAWLFDLNDDKGESWHWVKIFAAETYTLFSFQFEDSLEFSRQSKILWHSISLWFCPFALLPLCPYFTQSFALKLCPCPCH